MKEGRRIFHLHKNQHGFMEQPGVYRTVSNSLAGWTNRKRLVMKALLFQRLFRKQYAQSISELEEIIEITESNVFILPMRKSKLLEKKKINLPKIKLVGRVAKLTHQARIGLLWSENQAFLGYMCLHMSNEMRKNWMKKIICMKQKFLKILLILHS